MAVDKQSARLDPGAQRQRVEMVSSPRPAVKTERETAMTPVDRPSRGLQARPNLPIIECADIGSAVR
jgi:hypothetical protein